MRRLFLLFCLLSLFTLQSAQSHASMYTQDFFGTFYQASGAFTETYSFFPGNYLGLSIVYDMAKSTVSHENDTTVYSFKGTNTPSVSMAGIPPVPGFPSSLLGSISMGKPALQNGYVMNGSAATLSVEASGSFSLHYSFKPYYFNFNVPYDPQIGYATYYDARDILLDINYTAGSSMGTFAVSATDYQYMRTSQNSALQLVAGYPIPEGTGSGRLAGLTTTGTLSSVPVPGAIWLLGSGLAGLIGLRRKFLV